MNRAIGKNKQSGVALVFAILALALLSAIGAAMLYSSGLELGIAGNYRDKQVATYAAISGLQEAKDRILQSRDDADIEKIFMPDGLPSLNQPNIIYVINPKDGETVAPWDPSNKYADTDLCHGDYAKYVLGLSGKHGVPCSGSNAFPAGACTPGSAGCWYTVYNNSTYAGKYHEATPLDYKWVRIMLKTDNMTPVPVIQTPETTTSGKQVCWDGHNQLPNPAGYTPDCMPIGALARIDVTAGGDGYDLSNPPTITIGPPASGGTQATAQAVIKASPTDKVGSVSVTDPGSGYDKPPAVTLTGGGGSGATAVATIVTGPGVESATLTSPGPGCYASASGPTVSLTGGGGSGAAVDVTMTQAKDCIAAWTVVSSGCKEYENTTQTITGGGGFSGSVKFYPRQGNNAPVGSATIVNPGSGITTLNGYTFSKLTSCTLSITPTLGYAVTDVKVTAKGTNYTTPPTVNFQLPNSGSKPTATATLGPMPTNVGQIAGIKVVNGGSGYTSAPTVVLTPTGNGAGGAAIAALAQMGYISAINLTYAGSHYWKVPSVIIGTPGTGAMGKAILSKTSFYTPVVSITSLAMTPMGTRAMEQMEAAPELPGLNLGGALTLDGPAPDFGSPSSQQFVINGNDADSCGNGKKPAQAAIGVYDDPNNPTTPTAMSEVISELKKPANYIGAKSAPDVENIFASLGDSGATPEGAEALAGGVLSLADDAERTDPGGPPHKYYGDQTDSTVYIGTAGHPTVLYIDGNFTASGSTHGYGILLVTGNVVFSGNWSWDGLILVIGQGSFVANGGGNGQINGTVFIAKTKGTPPTGQPPSAGTLLPSLGSPVADFSGGGGNGIRYDHCLADDYMAQIPFVPPPSTKPLKVLSTHSLNY